MCVNNWNCCEDGLSHTPILRFILRVLFPKATRGFEPISYSGVLASTLLHTAVYVSLHNLLNVLVHIANKMGLQKKTIETLFRERNSNISRTRVLHQDRLAVTNERYSEDVHIVRCPDEDVKSRRFVRSSVIG
jgi:hypothetical protein